MWSTPQQSIRSRRQVEESPDPPGVYYTALIRAYADIPTASTDPVDRSHKGSDKAIVAWRRVRKKALAMRTED
jgi:hypothetical protein